MPQVTLESIDACYFCGGALGPEVFATDYTDLWDNAEGHRYAYHGCPSCDVIQLRNRPVAGPALGEFYARRGGCSWLDWQHPNPLLRWYAMRMQRTKLEILQRRAPLEPRMRVLEVGCGRGAFSALLAERTSCEIHANDLAEELSAVMHPRVQYRPGPFEHVFEHEGERFDRVVSHQVIEHVYNPRAFLEVGYRLLRPGGIMVVETINHRSASFRLFKDNWGQLCAPRHTVLFSDRFFSSARPAHLLEGAECSVHYEGFAASMSLWASSAIHALHLPMATSRASLAVAAGLYLATNPWLAPLERAGGLEKGIVTVVIRKPD